MTMELKLFKTYGGLEAKYPKTTIELRGSSAHVTFWGVDEADHGWAQGVGSDKALPFVDGKGEAGYPQLQEDGTYHLTPAQLTLVRGRGYFTLRLQSSQIDALCEALQKAKEWLR